MQISFMIQRNQHTVEHVTASLTTLRLKHLTQADTPDRSSAEIE